MGTGRAQHPTKRAIIIPALNEEESIAKAVQGLSKELFQQILVVDNGSRDRTAARARHAGAQVIEEPHRGYGRACWRGILSLASDIETLVFMDGDLSDEPRDACRLIETLENGGYDLVVGSRRLGKVEPGALAPWQCFGNWLATTLIRLFWGVQYTDLGPFRAIRMDALRKLSLLDRGFGWTVEMQAKAARLGMKTCEIPVCYRSRPFGKSKISGNLAASFEAGVKILWTLFICLFWRQKTVVQSLPRT